MNRIRFSIGSIFVATLVVAIFLGCWSKLNKSLLKFERDLVFRNEIAISNLLADSKQINRRLNTISFRTENPTMMDYLNFRRTCVVEYVATEKNKGSYDYTEWQCVTTYRVNLIGSEFNDHSETWIGQYSY